MESLSTKELYARNTENQITSIKELGLTGLVVGQVEFLASSCTDPEHEEMFNWILSCLYGDTEQVEAGQLTETQLLNASIVVSAVSDCATMVHYDKATI